MKDLEGTSTRPKDSSGENVLDKKREGKNPGREFDYCEAIEDKALNVPEVFDVGDIIEDKSANLSKAGTSSTVVVADGLGL